MATNHSGQYVRKVIVDKLTPTLESSATEIIHENGRFYIVELTMPDDWNTILEYYDNELQNQSGNGFLYRRSPWMYADPTENSYSQYPCYKRRTS